MSNIVTPNFVVSFPNVFRPKKNDLSGRDEYSLVALFPKGADLSALEAEAKRVMSEKWGPDPKKWPKPIRSPFRDQGERAKINDEGNEVLPAGHEKGAIFMNFKSIERPGLVDGKRQDILDESEFYAGCWARASVRAYAYDMKGNRGVAFGLQNIQKVKDGEPLTGRVKAQDEFSAIEVEGDEGSASNLFG